jgi:cytochrome b subunit of formate dehydrogenase
MTKARMLKILNPIMAIVFIAVIKAMFLYKFSPIVSMRGSELLAKIHTTAGVILFFLVVFHIYLNWNWVMTQLLGIKPKAKATKKK